MMEIKKNIQSLYAINLIEGEGVGTAYEYYVKLRKLDKFIRSIERPRKILIAGLPERYGLSMDFFLLGHILQSEMVVIDERSDMLERTREVISILKRKNLFQEANIEFIHTDSVAELNCIGLIKEKFDLALSSEVLQRLEGTQKNYISNIKKVALNFAIFAPNRGNESHANLSGLKSLYLRELEKYCRSGPTEMYIYDYGYIDMPPFPPGLNRSQEKRQQASESRFEFCLMKGLEFYSLCEDFIPKSIKEKIAHIVFIMGKNR